jgi:hypothetical protein
MLSRDIRVEEARNRSSTKRSLLDVFQRSELFVPEEPQCIGFLHEPLRLRIMYAGIFRLPAFNEIVRLILN